MYSSLVLFRLNQQRKHPIPSFVCTPLSLNEVEAPVVCRARPPSGVLSLSVRLYFVLGSIFWLPRVRAARSAPVRHIFSLPRLHLRTLSVRSYPPPLCGSTLVALGAVPRQCRSGLGDTGHAAPLGTNLQQTTTANKATSSPPGPRAIPTPSAPGGRRTPLPKRPRHNPRGETAVESYVDPDAQRLTGKEKSRPAPKRDSPPGGEDCKKSHQRRAVRGGSPP